jgi:hypothetical protein
MIAPGLKAPTHRVVPTLIAPDGGEAGADKRPFSCSSVAMSVRTRPMLAINLGSVAVISRQCGILNCNERAHGPPMFAIPTPDVCRSLQIEATCVWQSASGTMKTRSLSSSPLAPAVSLPSAFHRIGISPGSLT